MADSFCFITGAHVDMTGRLFAAPVPGASNPGQVTARAGGAGLNSASTAAALGANVVVASPVGDDAQGENLRRTLAARGIGNALAMLEGARTGTYTTIIAPDGSMVIGLADLAIYEAVGAQWFFDHCGAALDDADVWFVNANLPAATLSALAARAGGRKLAAATISPAKAPRLAAILAQTSFLFTNVGEARALTGLAQAEAPRLVEALIAAGARSGTISAGAGPLSWWHNGQTGTLLPPPVKTIIDVNGAGDALAATVLVALTRGHDFKHAARLGIAAAQLTLGSPEPYCPQLDWRLLESAAVAITA